VLSSFEPGGTERQMSELIRRLDPERFRVHAVCFRRTGAWLARVEAAASEVADFPLRSFKSPTSLPTLVRLATWLRRREIAVLHACDFYANVFAVPAAVLARVPVRIGSRRDLIIPGRTPAQMTAQRLSYRAAHRVVANSTAAAAQLRAEGVPTDRIVVIANGIDLTRFSGGGRVDRGKTVATVANLRPEKGHDVLLRAAARVLQRLPDVRFRIIGDGPTRPALIELASALGISKSIEFLGHREDVPALLAESDVYAFPSRTEAFPNGLIEAMAAGLPVVASAVGGMLELVEDGRNGRLVAAGDDAALATRILELLTDAPTARQFGEAARATIASRYSFDRMVASFDHLYVSELTRRCAAWGLPQTRVDTAPLR
jgi:glycosyltransferase involved in cell wall biosynthesis